MALRDKESLDFLADSIGEIERDTTGVDLGGAIVPNRIHLDLALRRLRLHLAERSTGPDRATCYCRLFAQGMFFRPERLREEGRVVIDAETVFRDESRAEYRCHCADCGCRFDVHEEIGWHLPTWRWQELSEG